MKVKYITLFICLFTLLNISLFSFQHNISDYYIEDVGRNGKVLMLNDGSVWKIYPIDQITVMLWLDFDNISVYGAENPIGDFKYLLKNEDDLVSSEMVFAEFMGN